MSKLVADDIQLDNEAADARHPNVGGTAEIVTRNSSLSLEDGGVLLCYITWKFMSQT